VAVVVVALSGELRAQDDAGALPSAATGPGAADTVAQPPSGGRAANGRRANPPDPPPAAEAERPEPPPIQRRGDIVRFGQDYTLPAGSASGDLVLIFGSANVEGTVFGDLVVVMGSARLGTGAVVHGDTVVIGGNLDVASGAVASRDVVTVGGVMNAPSDFVSGGEHVIVGYPGLETTLRNFSAWLTGGLFWGRLVVPRLGWIWAVLAITFVIYLAVALLFNSAVETTGKVLSARPAGSLFAGLIVLALAGPLSFLLAVSVVGLVAVPVLMFALVAAAVIGKIGVLWWTGSRLVPQSDSSSRLQFARSVVLGFVLLAALYAVPVVALMTWATTSVVGLGAAVLAVSAAYRRETPRMPAPSSPPLPPPQLAPDLSSGAPAIFATSPVPDASSELPRSPVAAVAIDAGGLVAFPRATLLDRAAAFVLDVIIVLIVVRLLQSFGTRSWEPMFMFLFVSYRIGLWAWKGTTIGGIVGYQRLVRTNGDPVQFIDAFVRGLASVLSFGLLGLGYLWALKDPERQTWHDKIAGTYVVKVPRNWPMP
jgi:uncharacterized RDD family membrane protein YckC